MSRTREEIIKALEILKDVCIESSCCVVCPLRADNDYSCSLGAFTPRNFVLNDSSKRWRALTNVRE